MVRQDGAAPQHFSMEKPSKNEVIHQFDLQVTLYTYIREMLSLIGISAGTPAILAEILWFSSVPPG
jgi:hypothetical protein